MLFSQSKCRLCIAAFVFKQKTLPLAMSAFLRVIDAKHQIVKCNIRIGVAHDTLAKVSRDTATAIVAMTGNIHFGDDDLANVLK